MPPTMYQPHMLGYRKVCPVNYNEEDAVLCEFAPPESSARSARDAARIETPKKLKGAGSEPAQHAVVNSCAVEQQR